MKQIIRIITQLREWMFLHLLGKDGREIWSRLREVYITNMDPKHYGMIGKHYSLGTEMTSVPTNVFLEDYTRIQNHLNFISYKGKLTVKKYAAIGAGCIIIPGDHVPTVGVPQYLAGRLHINDVDGEIIVGEDAWIGAGTILLSHCKIGRGAVVAAGAVVSKEVPPYAVVAGVPAKIIATRFSLEQIVAHEIKLYTKEERMTKVELERLFCEYYQGKRSIGKSEMSKKDEERLRATKAELEMTDFTEKKAER